MKNRNYLLRKPLLVAALIFCWHLVRPALAQVTELQPGDGMSFTGVISEGTCPFLIGDSGSSIGAASVDTLNLSSRPTRLDGETFVGAFMPIALNQNLPDFTEPCTSMVGRYAVRSFDSELASITAYDGLLRNTATRDPATNVFGQLGLVSANGAFAPVDLNQPQALNRAIKKQLNQIYIAPEERILLGLRYVSDPPIVALSANSQGTATPIEPRVSPGNVRAYIPFLQKLN
jgi:hypothetical protein